MNNAIDSGTTINASPTQLDPSTPTRLRRDARLSRRNGGILACPVLMERAADEIDQLREMVRRLLAVNAVNDASEPWFAPSPGWECTHRNVFAEAEALIGFGVNGSKVEGGAK